MAPLHRSLHVRNMWTLAVLIGFLYFMESVQSVQVFSSVDKHISILQGMRSQNQTEKSKTTAAGPNTEAKELTNAAAMVEHGGLCTWFAAMLLMIIGF